MTYRIPAFGRAVLILAMVLATAGPVAGQEAASIIGRVIDESNLALPGVTVTATSPGLQVPSVTTVTDGTGQYRLSPLPIGIYTVEYQLPGFQTVERTEIRLTLGFVATLDITLGLGAVQETVIVSGASPVVDVRSATPTTEFLRETLELLPTTRNGILSVIVQAPGVRPVARRLDVGGNQFTAQPEYNNFGRRGDEWTTIDGVLTTSGNGTPEGVYWDFSTFEEASISTSGATAEMPGSGVSLTGVVKSGGNDFHGGAFYSVARPGFEATNIDADLSAAGVTGGNELLERFDISGDLGGRLVRDKVWFYTSARRALDNAQIIGVFKPDGSPGNLLRIQKFMTTKVSYQLSQSHRLVGFYQWNSKRNAFSISALNDWDTRVLHLQTGYAEKAEWQGTFGNAIAASTHFGYYRYDAPLFTNSDQVGTYDLGTRRRTGAAIGLGGVDADQFRWQVHSGLTGYKSDLFGASHEFKAGFDYTPGVHDWDYWDRTGVQGAEDGTPGDNGPAFGQNYYLRYFNGAPFEIGTLNRPVRAISRAVYSGGFVQDSMTFDRLTLSLGLRYDYSNGFIPEQSRRAGTFGEAQTFPKVPFAKWNSLAPRLHFAFDVTGDGRTAIKGGWGRFNKIRFTNELRSGNPNDHIETNYTWNDLNGDNSWDPTQVGEVNLDPNGPDFVRSRGSVRTPRLPNLDEQQPKVDEFSINIERELVQNFSVRMTAVYTRESNLRRLEAIGRPFDSYAIPVTNFDPGPDGSLGTADDTGNLVTYFEYPEELRGRAFEAQMFINDPANTTNTYKAIEVTTQKRFSQGWLFNGTIGVTFINQPLGARRCLGRGLCDLQAFTPNESIFAERDVRDWYGKFSASYEFPGRVMASSNWTAVSGEHYARQVTFRGGSTITSLTVPVEAINANKYDNIHLVDVRVQKTLEVGAGHDVAIRFDVFNLLNINTVHRISLGSGSNFERPLSIIAPRIGVFAVTYEF
jgi:hypothetical protein